MFDGCTTGRGFETPLAPWIWGILCLLAAGLWLWERRRIKRLEREERARDEDGDDGTG
jgi:hypothetical protein